MRIVVIPVALASLVLTGCSSLMTSYKSRSMSKHGVLYKEKFFNGQVFVLTGDRRVAIAVPTNPDRAWNFCSESLPDVAAAAGASTNINLSTTAADGNDKGLAIGDAFTQSLLKTFTRTENAELFRNWNFAFCMASAQGRLTDAESTSAKLFTQMTTGLIEVMKKNAEKGGPAPAGGPDTAMASAATEANKANEKMAAEKKAREEAQKKKTPESEITE